MTFALFILLFSIHTHRVCANVFYTGEEYLYLNRLLREYARENTDENGLKRPRKDLQGEGDRYSMG